jgi:hypothetical protein
VHGGNRVEHANACQFDWHDDDRTIEAGEMKRHVGERPIGRAEAFEELVYAAPDIVDLGLQPANRRRAGRDVA